MNIRCITRAEAEAMFPAATEVTKDEPVKFKEALFAFRRDHATPPRSDAALIEKALEEETHARKHRST